MCCPHLLLPPFPLQPPAVKKEEDLEELEDRAQVRLLLWLGLEQDQSEWTRAAPGGEIAVFAETVSGVCACVMHACAVLDLAEESGRPFYTAHLPLLFTQGHIALSLAVRERGMSLWSLGHYRSDPSQLV